MSATFPELAANWPLLTVDDQIATILLRRPAQHNRIDPDDLEYLSAHLDRIERDAHIRVLVFRGCGDRTFSSGYTVEAILSHLEERGFERFLNRLEQLGTPTVAAIQGGVYGGATDLALCCDIRIGVATSRMFMPAARFGLHYYPDGIRRYVDRLGATSARRLMLTGMTIEAEEMLRIGFLTECVAPDALDMAVDRSIEALLSCEPGAIRTMKASLNQLGQLDRATYDDIERRYLDSLRSDVLRERIAASSRNRRGGNTPDTP